MTAKRREVLFAVVRFDDGASEPQTKVTIKAVFPTADMATAEAARLNALHPKVPPSYFVQQAKFFPDGFFHEKTRRPRNAGPA